VFVEDEVATAGGVVQGQGHTMLTDENVFQRECETVADNRLRALNDCIHITGFTRDNTASGAGSR
jgi:hypothetical protein